MYLQFYVFVKEQPYTDALQIGVLKNFTNIIGRHLPVAASVCAFNGLKI